MTQFGYPFVLVIDKLKEAQKYHDMGIPVMFGSIEDPETFQSAGIKNAAMVVATDDDIRNVNVAFRARDVDPKLPIVGTCNNPSSEDIIELAGANHVIRIAKQMGSFLARRISCTDNNTHVIGSFGEVLIAEATVHGTPLVGKQLQETTLREEYGVNVVGFGKEGILRHPSPAPCSTTIPCFYSLAPRPVLHKYDDDFRNFSSNLTGHYYWSWPRGRRNRKDIARNECSLPGDRDGSKKGRHGR